MLHSASESAAPALPPFGNIFADVSIVFFFEENQLFCLLQWLDAEQQQNGQNI
jgi:hypothetical protein